MTNPISGECAAIAARERRDGVLDALACALMDADRIHQPGACICRHGDGFSVVLEPYVEHDTVIDVDGNPVGVSKGARLALLHALGGVPSPSTCAPAPRAARRRSAAAPAGAVSPGRPGTARAAARRRTGDRRRPWPSAGTGSCWRSTAAACAATGREGGDRR